MKKPKGFTDDEKVIYTEIKVSSTQHYSHLFIDTKYSIDVQISTSDTFKIEKINIWITKKAEGKKNIITSQK